MERAVGEIVKLESFELERSFQLNGFPCINKNLERIFQLHICRVNDVFLYVTRNFRQSVKKFEGLLEKMDELFIGLGYLGQFVLGSDIQAAVKGHLVTLEHGIPRIWPRDEEGLEIIALFQRDNLLRDLRDLAVLSPPDQPRAIVNFAIFD